MSEESSGTSSSSGVFHFSYKTWTDHVRGVFSHPTRLLGTAFGMFAALWTVTEVAIQLSQVNPSGWQWYLSLLALSFIAAVTSEVVHYSQECPEGLENVSRKAQPIAHIQRSNWEFELAKHLLVHRIAPIDRECRDLLGGKTFVVAEPFRNGEEYMNWLSSRTDNMFRMIETTQQLLICDLPDAMRSTKSKPACPKLILSAIEAIERLYRESVVFERRSHSIIPPEPFQRIHQLQQGWAEPVRDGILQMIQVLQTLCELDPNSESNVSLGITLRPASNLDEFSKEFEHLSGRLHEVLEVW